VRRWVLGSCLLAGLARACSRVDSVRRTQVVVLTGTPLAEALRVDELCHRAGVAFIRADVRGVFARVFCDFGPAFTVFDVDGAALETVARTCLSAGSH